MSSTKETLQQFAKDIAVSREHTILRLSNKLADIDREKAEIESALHTAHLALQRARNYQPIFGREFRCPRLLDRSRDDE